MTITIAPEVEALVRERAQLEGVSVDVYIEKLIVEHQAWAECTASDDEEDEAEYVEIEAALERSMAQLQRGETVPADQAFAELRQKYGYSR